MNGNGFIEKIGGIDPVFVQEAMTRPAVRQKRVRMRWTAIAACLVVVFSITAYATDLFGVIFSSRPENGSITVVGADGQTTEYPTWYYDVTVPSVKPKNIKGEVNKLTETIKNQIEADKKGEYVPDPPRSYEYRPDYYFVEGLSAEEAAKFVGYKYLEPLWFPYEKCATLVQVQAAENDQGQCVLKMIMISSGNTDASGKTISPEGLEGNLMVSTGVYISIDSDETPYHTKLGGFDDEGSYTITNSKGHMSYICETPKDLSIEQLREISGGAFKNGLYHIISIVFSENNRPEAERIVHEWAEQF